MIGVNRWYGIGNMTADPKLSRGDEADRDRCEFSIAINKPGDSAEPTYLDLVTWGKLAGQVNDFGRKGRLVFCDGELEVRKWEDAQTGERKRMYRVKAYVVRFLDRRPDDEAGDDRPREERRDDRRDERRDDRASGSRPAEPASRARDFDDLPF